MQGKKHLTSIHGKFGMLVILLNFALAAMGAVALNPDWGFLKTNKNFRSIHKYSGRAITAAAWLSCAFGFMTVEKDVYRRVAFFFPLLGMAYYVLQWCQLHWSEPTFFANTVEIIAHPYHEKSLYKNSVYSPNHTFVYLFNNMEFVSSPSHFFVCQYLHNSTSSVSPDIRMVNISEVWRWSEARLNPLDYRRSTIEKPTDTKRMKKSHLNYLWCVTANSRLIKSNLSCQMPWMLEFVLKIGLL